MLLIATSVTLIPTTVADWDPEDGHKMHWPQLPDPDGYDVYATDGLDQFPWVVLADDWQCPETGWIKDIHFWGSWWNDIIGEIDHFVIGIADNNHADQQIPWSRPGKTLVEWEIYDWEQRGPFNGNQGWYWPPIDWTHPNHNLYWQYNVFLDEKTGFGKRRGPPTGYLYQQ